MHTLKLLSTILKFSNANFTCVRGGCNTFIYIYHRCAYIHAHACRCLSVVGRVATTMVAVIRHIDEHLSFPLLYTLLPFVVLCENRFLQKVKIAKMLK